MSKNSAGVQRFSPRQRFEHWVLMVAFLGLALTGLPQKYAEQDWSQTLVSLMDGVENIRVVHRVFAVLLLIVIAYHVTIVAYKLWVLGKSASLAPRRRDFRDAVEWIKFNVHLKHQRPAMPHYNFAEKLDYWISVTGLAFLALTGLILWNPILVTDLLPGEVVPAAQQAHAGEALFMVLAIGLWHLYGVFIKQFNLSMLTGKLSQQQMEQEHAEALASEAPTPKYAAAEIQKRRQRFFPIAGVILVVLAAAMYWLLTTEDTALETVPRQEVQLFAPDLNLQEGDANVGEALWGTLRCSRCHGMEAAGVPDGAPGLRGLELTFDEFILQVREGGEEMPAFSHLEVSDVYVLHLWTWLTSLSAS